MSFSERHARGEHGRFATGGAFTASAGKVFVAGEPLAGVSDVRVKAVHAAAMAPSWRHPLLWWRRRRARRRIAEVRARQRVYSGTFTVKPDENYERLLYQWFVGQLVSRQARSAPWSLRAIAKAITLRIVLRMVRGG